MTTTSARAHRLPRSIWPRRYDIDLEADPARPDFSGHVTITLDVREPAAQIELHARQLALAEATLEVGGAVAPVAIELDAERQLATFRPAAPLPPGPATLRVAFSGRLNPSMHGLYLATDGKDRALCTQCEATDARGIFPCFDEPEFKAELRWNVRTTPGLLALSNGALESGDPASGSYRFHPTPRVSSYLAALCIGDLEGTEQTVVRDTPVRVFAPRGKGRQGRFAHGFTEKLLPYYEDYFAQRYAYGKYDQVAVPGFDAGAMENVGLVLFRQNLLLMDEGAASWRQEKLIALVVAHELAHMWFGNLVTMRWWDDLWLNEAFAEWMAHKAVHAVAPDYRCWDDFQDDKNRALSDDAMPTTHPIWTAVETPEQAIEMFDSITYQKGCAVMRMLENFLGEEPFRAGLRAYMAAFAGGNAAGPDLWSKLEESSGLPVGELMRSWIAQPGFPVLSARLAEGKGGAVLSLRQRRFFSGPADAAADNDQLWLVPVVVRFEDDGGVKEHRFILRGREHEEPLPATGPIRWCHGNAGEVGFYRLALDEDLARGLLGPGLPHLSPVEQMGFIEDRWALVRNGSAGIGPFIDVLAALSAVPDHNVLRAVVDRLGTLDLLLKDSGDRAARGRFRTFIAGLFRDQLAQVGYAPRPGEAQNEVQRRTLLIYALGSLARVPEVITEAQALAERERRDPRAVDPNLAGAVVAIAARFGDGDRFSAFVETFQERRGGGATPQETQRYLHALSSFRPPELVSRTLSLLSDGTIPQESVGSLYGQLLGGRHGQDAAWEALKAGWDTLRERVGDMGLSRLVEAVGHLRHERKDDVVAFFQKNAPRGAERALGRALTAMEQREELRRRVTPDLLARFA